MDYKKLKFKCGLEIHKQLESHKLFCHCPTIIDNSEPELRIKRKLRAVAGEAGKKDIAALYEETKNKTFIYEYSDKYGCLTCIDEEPPSLINQQALKIVLEISLLLNAKILPKIKVMRKIIIDGSNPSSYQRTCLIAKNGYIKTSKGKVRIPTIYLEEDAARKIKEDKNTITYRVDRLGFPLVEIATAPDIKDSEHAKETASLLGMILKSTEKVKGGIGSIRQDVNISIKNSPRIEIKGFQDLRSIPKIIEYEVNRLIKEKPKKPEVRKAESDLTTSFLRPLPGELRMYPDTDESIYKITKQLLKQIKIPELITEKSLKLEKTYNLQPELAKEIIENKIDFPKLIKKYSRISPHLIAHILIELPKEIKKRFKIKKQLKESDFKFIFEALNKNKILKEAVIDIASDLLKNKKPSLKSYKPISQEKIQKEIENIVAKNPGASINALMGIAMSKFRGTVEGKKLIEIIKKYAT